MRKFRIGENVILSQSLSEREDWVSLYGEKAIVVGFDASDMPVRIQFGDGSTARPTCAFTEDELEPTLIELTMDSPAERETKLVLVTINWRDGKTSWRLAGARKIGRHYVIDESALQDMQRDYWQGWPPRTDMDTWESLMYRPQHLDSSK